MTDTLDDADLDPPGGPSRRDPIGPLLGHVRPDASALPASETKKRLLARFGATPSPSRLDRYTMEQPLGRGGWGVVFAAYDERLQRRVAIKLLHERVRSGSTSLLREARAMARVAHNNVVAIHDVGEADGQLFIVMDLVEGTSLARWLHQHRPPWPKIVELFVEAGRGLQCAHEAGLVHRDFKAANVLVGDDGRVQVTDFGVAAPQAELREHSVAAGTPGYQAPEVLAGEPLDASADQYSYCAALREALDDRRAGPTPRWLEQATARGQSPRAADRWPSMKALVDRLEGRLRARATKKRAAFVAGVSAASVAAIWGVSASQAPSACELRAQATAGSVRARAVAIAEAFDQASGRAQWDAQQPKLQALAERLGQQQRDACEATDTSTDAQRRREICIDQRSWELRSLLDVFEHANPTVVDHASVAVALLQDAADCDEPSPVPLPSADQYAATLSARQTLARAKKLEHAGQYEAALEQAEAALAGATEAAYAPLMAEAAYRRAMQLLSLGRYNEARDTLSDALRSAQAGRHDPMVAWSQALLASTEGYYLGDAAAGRAWAEAADATVHRLDGDPVILGALEGIRSANAIAAGEFARARDHAERALVLRRQVWPSPDDHPYVAGALLALGNAMYRSQQFEEATRAYEQALQMRQRLLGSDHPDTGIAHNNVALTLMAAQDYDGARTHLDRAEAIARRSPADAIHLHRVRYNRAQIDLAQDKVSVARGELEALLQTSELAARGLPLRRRVLTSLARALMQQGAYDEAEQRLDEAAAELGEGHPFHARIDAVRDQLARRRAEPPSGM